MTRERCPAQPTVSTSLEIPAVGIAPGDYLPPQRILHGTRWQQTGFQVGDEPMDVCVNLPVLSGRVLLFGPTGTLSTIRDDATVTVVRTRADTCNAA